MKRLILSMLVVFSACSENMKIEQPEIITGEKVRITATIGADNTKVSQEYDVTENVIKINWSDNGESFGVFQEGGSTVTIFEQTNDNPSVFEGQFPLDGTQNKYYAFYPSTIAEKVNTKIFGTSLAGNLFTAQDGTLRPEMCIMKSVKNGNAFHFEHLMSIIKPTFNYNGNTIDNTTITNITISSPTIRTSEWATSVSEFVNIEANCSSLEDIFLYISTNVESSSADRSFNVTVRTTNGTNYSGVLTVPEGNTLVAGKLYTPEILLSIPSVCNLSGETEPTHPRGTGNESDPYLISNGAELLWVVDQASSASITTKSGSTSIQYYKLENDICIETTDEKPWTLGLIAPFTGVFDGNGKTISGRLVAPKNAPVFGFIGVNKGIVKNLNISADVIGGKGTTILPAGLTLTDYSNRYIENLNVTAVGAVAGLNQGTIENCVNRGNVTGINTEYNQIFSVSGVGGIVGLSFTDNQTTYVKNCINYGTVTGTNINNTSDDNLKFFVWSIASGIVGGSFGVEITDCINVGTIKGGKLNEGVSISSGVLGIGQNLISPIKIKRCSNSGTINGAENYYDSVIGGIAGLINGGMNSEVIINGIPNSYIKDCYNSGNIKSLGACAGGIGGQIYTAHITNCINKIDGAITVNGNIGKDFSAGGISGEFGSASSHIVAKITDCENYAPIYGTEIGNKVFYGGIAGELYGGNTEVTNTKNYGIIDGKGSEQVEMIHIGGISGASYGGYTKIYNCENYGEIKSGKSNVYIYAGGISGEHYSFINGGTEMIHAGRICTTSNFGKITEGNSKNSYYGGIAGYIGNISDFNTIYKPFVCTSCTNSNSQEILLIGNTNYLTGTCGQNIELYYHSCTNCN